jgi:prepilin-type processing-associated H-X9-DG protein
LSRWDEKIGLVAGAFGVTVSAAMKTLPAKAKISGFTLIELLAVIFVLFVSAALLLPMFGRVKSGRQFQCMANQRQIALAFLIFSGDNNGQFPWQLSATNGGSLEAIANGHVFPHFQPLSQELANQPRLLICPTDKDKQIATNYSQLRDENISYFVNVDANTNKPSNSILSGDRFLVVGGQPVKSGLFIVTSNLNIGWMSNIHWGRGSLAFADGHAEFDRTNELSSAIQRQPLATNRFVVP